jgi:hypothetical protein
MHDSTRRNLCRLAFFALCLAPSGSLCAWVLYRATPMHAWQEQAFWAESIYQTTGLLAEIERVRHRTRTRTLLEGVTLSDPDGGHLVARVRVIEFAETDHGMVAMASQPEIEAHQLQRLGQLLYQRVLRGPRPTQQFQLLSGELTLHGASSASTATDVRCLVSSDQGKVEATIDFLVAGFEMHSPAQIKLTRERDSGKASTTWQIRTGGTPLPCDMIADYLPALQSLGTRCRFQGTVWVQQDDESWDGEIAGLQVSGLCDDRQEGVVLVGTSGGLLLDSRAELIPSIALARALVPQSELQVPATTATEQILRALPLPSPKLPTSGTARRPWSPSKLLR